MLKGLQFYYEPLNGLGVQTLEIRIRMAKCIVVGFRGI